MIAGFFILELPDEPFDLGDASLQDVNVLIGFANHSD
jgi:hypothetical protein